MLALKLALSPTLILIASLAARRWGVLVAGWIAGFPLTSGPVSIFLAVEQGPAFAATAARATLVGVVAMIGFCLGYARLAPAHGAVVSMAGGLLVLLVLAAALVLLVPSLPVTLGLLAAALLLSLAAIPRTAERPPPSAPPWWDMPARMLIAVGLVFGLTEFADRLGPDVSGLISPVPVFASVIAVFTHRHQGGQAAAEFLRGVVLGGVSFSAFFLVVALALGSFGLPTAYGLAAVVSALVNLAALGWDRARSAG